MTMKRADLSAVSSSALERLLESLRAGRLRAPFTRADVLALGIRHQVDAIAAALEGHTRLSCEAVMEAVLAERARHSRPAPDLVWTGPEGDGATARDTAVVLRELFEGAQRRVLLAGYSFDHAWEVLEPLHRVMMERGVIATFVVDMKQVEHRVDPPEAYAAERMDAFVKGNWPFGPPYPRLFYDKRALAPWPKCSMHAKCLVIDEERAFVSSANFTQRGQERNIEVGVLLHDPLFAGHLARQWQSLIDGDLCREWRVETR